MHIAVYGAGGVGGYFGGRLTRAGAGVRLIVCRLALGHG
jgi:ketopantoate reductase